MKCSLSGYVNNKKRENCESKRSSQARAALPKAVLMRKEKSSFKLVMCFFCGGANEGKIIHESLMSSTHT